MTTFKPVTFSFIAFLLTVSAGAFAEKSGNEICQKMISDGRGNGMSQDDCLCLYRHAEETLDDDMKALLFDAWYTGNNNMQAMAELPKQGRVAKKMRRMKRAIDANCNLS